ncbi:MAG TPA: hypothetical protein VFG75_12005 [Gaiella sp.]|nr:hypothetical protein [Gaiella sp.]
MHSRAGVLSCLVIVGLVSLWTFAPRLHHDFPSMVDDWSAIKNAPTQLHVVLRLGLPEPTRYRPGFVMWNALQWHTLGAPTHFLGPQIWGIARWTVFVVGVTLCAILLVGRPGRPRDGRWPLVVGVPLVAVTVPSVAVDIARWGPQEPLLVGCMALGAVLLVRAIDRLLDGGSTRPGVVAALGAGLLLWAFGVLQKETSICALLLIPFLWPTLKSQRVRWNLLSRGRRRGLEAVATAILLPFLPMVARTAQLALADERVYEGAAASKSLTTRLSDQLSQAGGILHSQLPTVIFVAAVVLLAAVTFLFGADWLSIGLLLVGVAFVAFAADVGVVESRYYVPPITLAAIVVARSAVRLGSTVVIVTGILLTGGGLLQAHSAHERVSRWVEGEKEQEVLVREAAGRVAGGCSVVVVGRNVEYVQALPVLMSLAQEPPRGCASDARYVVVLDRLAAGSTPPDDPVLAACRPDPNLAFDAAQGYIARCTR